MFLVLFVALAVATVPLLGGRLFALADLSFRGFGFLGASLALQVLIISVVPGGPRLLLTLGHVLSYVLIGVFLWMNRAVTGLAILAIGWGLNSLVISVNGGTMPGDPELAERGSRGVVDASQFVNSRPLEAPRLAWLGDNFALPSDWPLNNVFSIGDVFIAAGAFVVLHFACHSLVATLWAEGFDRVTTALRARTAADV
jgi:hypothetical protein